MVTKYLEVGYNDWGILVNFDFDESDHDDISAALQSFGMNRRNINKALRILSHFNTGMAVSNDGLRMTTIYIGNATSPSQFWSTAIHEAKHAADAIIDYYGVDWQGEDAAYLTGYITKRMVELLGDPCK